MRASRSVALLLLAVFLGAGSSLPSLDALLFHWHAGAQTVERPHIEPAGGCSSHAEHCTLGQSGPGARAFLGRASLARMVAGAAAAAPPAPPRIAFAASPDYASRPRPPPAPRA